MQRKKMHTLQRFGTENFRAPISVTSNSSTLNSIRKKTTEELWRHTREPMKAPLLQKLQHDKVQSEIAVTVFTLILKVRIA